MIADTRSQLERGYSAIARTLISSVDAQLQSDLKTLQGLATSPSLQPGDLAAFHDQAKRFVEAHGDWAALAVVDIAGREQILNTAASLSGDGAVGVFLDVTDGKRLEADLRTAKKAAEEASEANTRFLASFSHDLRQPLMAQRLLLHVAASRTSSPEQALTLARIGDALDGTESMLSRLMDLAALELGKVTVNLDPPPLSTVHHPSLQLMRVFGRDKWKWTRLGCRPTLRSGLVAKGKMSDALESRRTAT